LVGRAQPDSVSRDGLQAFLEFLERLREEARIACDAAKEEARDAADGAAERTRGAVARGIAEFQAEKDAQVRRLIAPPKGGIAQKLERARVACAEVERAIEDAQGGAKTARLMAPLREGWEAFADLEDAVVRGDGF
jgi:hypothetical protein